MESLLGFSLFCKLPGKVSKESFGCWVNVGMCEISGFNGTGAYVGRFF